MKNIKVIEVSEFDKLVFDTYGKPYSFQEQDGCKGKGKKYITVPCIEHDYKADNIQGERKGVSFKAWLNKDIDEPFGKRKSKIDNALFWFRNFYPHVSMIINDLFAKGLLEKGEYAIEIDW